MAISLTQIIANSEDTSVKSFATVQSNCRNQAYFTDERPINRMSSWEGYYYKFGVSPSPSTVSAAGGTVTITYTTQTNKTAGQTPTVTTTLGTVSNVTATDSTGKGTATITVSSRGADPGEALRGVVVVTCGGATGTCEFAQAANQVTGVAIKSVVVSGGSLANPATYAAVGESKTVSNSTSPSCAVTLTLTYSSTATKDTTSYSSYGTLSGPSYSWTKSGDVALTSSNAASLSVAYGNNQSTSERTSTVTRTASYTFTLNSAWGGASKGNSATTSATVKQSAGAKVYGSYTGTLTLNKTSVGAGADSVTVTYGKVYRPYTWNGVSGSGGNEYYSGNVYLTTSVNTGTSYCSTSSSAANSSSSTSSGTVTKTTYGTTPIASQTYTVYLRIGSTSGSAVASKTFTTTANAITSYGNITITSHGSANDIPATGGSVRASGGTGTQTITYTSTATRPGTVTCGTYTSVSRDPWGAEVVSRTKVGTSTATLTGEGSKTATVSVDIYQAANSVKTYGAVTISTFAYSNVGPSSSAMTVSPSISASQTITYTSNATRNGTITYSYSESTTHANAAVNTTNGKVTWDANSKVTSDRVVGVTVTATGQGSKSATKTTTSTCLKDYITTYGTPSVSIGSGLTAGASSATVSCSGNNTWKTGATSAASISWSITTNGNSRFSKSGNTLSHSTMGTYYGTDTVVITAVNDGDTSKKATATKSISNTITITSVTSTPGSLTNTSFGAGKDTKDVTSTGASASAVLTYTSGSKVTTNYNATDYGTWTFHGYSSSVNQTWATINSTAWNKTNITVSSRGTTTGDARTATLTRSEAGFTFTLKSDYGGASKRSTGTSCTCTLTQAHNNPTTLTQFSVDSVSPTSTSVTAASGSFTLSWRQLKRTQYTWPSGSPATYSDWAIEANAGISSVSSNQTWATVGTKKNSDANGYNSITISYGANQSSSSRSATITIINGSIGSTAVHPKTCTISQAAHSLSSVTIKSVSVNGGALTNPATYAAVGATKSVANKTSPSCTVTLTLTYNSGYTTDTTSYSSYGTLSGPTYSWSVVSGVATLTSSNAASLNATMPNNTTTSARSSVVRRTSSYKFTLSSTYGGASKSGSGTADATCSQSAGSVEYVITPSVTAMGTLAAAGQSKTSTITYTTKWNGTATATGTALSGYTITENTDSLGIVSASGTTGTVTVTSSNNKSTSSGTFKYTISKSGYTSATISGSVAAGSVVNGNWTGGAITFSKTSLAAGADSCTVTIQPWYYVWTWNGVSGSGGTKYYKGTVTVSENGSYTSLSATSYTASSSAKTLTLSKTTCGTSVTAAATITITADPATSGPGTTTGTISQSANYMTAIAIRTWNASNFTKASGGRIDATTDITYTSGSSGERWNMLSISNWSCSSTGFSIAAQPDYSGQCRVTSAGRGATSGDARSCSLTVTYKNATNTNNVSLTATKNIGTQEANTCTKTTETGYSVDSVSPTSKSVTAASGSFTFSWRQLKRTRTKYSGWTSGHSDTYSNWTSWSVETSAKPSSVTSNQTWATVGTIGTSKSDGKNSVTITYSANQSSSSRSATITVTNGGGSGSCSLSQAAHSLSSVTIKSVSVNGGALTNPATYAAGGATKSVANKTSPSCTVKLTLTYNSGYSTETTSYSSYGTLSGPTYSWGVVSGAATLTSSNAASLNVTMPNNTTTSSRTSKVSRTASYTYTLKSAYGSASKSGTGTTDATCSQSAGTTYYRIKTVTASSTSLGATYNGWESIYVTMQKTVSGSTPTTSNTWSNITGTEAKNIWGTNSSPFYLNVNQAGTYDSTQFLDLSYGSITLLNGTGTYKPTVNGSAVSRPSMSAEAKWRAEFIWHNNDSQYSRKNTVLILRDPGNYGYTGEGKNYITFTQSKAANQTMPVYLYGCNDSGTDVYYNFSGSINLSWGDVYGTTYGTSFEHYGTCALNTGSYGLTSMLGYNQFNITKPSDPGIFRAQVEIYGSIENTLNSGRYRGCKMWIEVWDSNGYVERSAEQEISRNYNPLGYTPRNLTFILYGSIYNPSEVRICFQFEDY